MTVKELIEKLKDMPQDANVYPPYHEEAESVEYYPKGNEVDIRFY